MSSATGEVLVRINDFTDLTARFFQIRSSGQIKLNTPATSSSLDGIFNLTTYRVVIVFISSKQDRPDRLISPCTFFFFHLTNSRIFPELCTTQPRNGPMSHWTFPRSSFIVFIFPNRNNYIICPGGAHLSPSFISHSRESNNHGHGMAFRVFRCVDIGTNKKSN